MNVSVASIKPGKNLRRSMGKLDELVQSIQSQGIIEPLIVATEGDGYELVAGFRRFEAAKKAKLSEVPVIVRDDLDEAGRVEVQAIENLQREDLDAIEEAETYQRLLEVTKVSQRELAPRIGRSQALISKRLSLLGLPEGIQKEIVGGSVNLGDAEEVARLSDAKMQEQVIKAVKNDRLTTARSLVDRMIAEDKRVAKVKESRAKAAKLGVKVIPYQDVEAGGDIWFVEDQGEYDGVGMTAKAHEKEPCNAVTIDPNGKLLAVCIDVERHLAPVVDLSKDEDGKTKDAPVKVGKEFADAIEPVAVEPRKPTEAELETQRQQEREKKQEQLQRAAKKARGEFIVSNLLAGRLPAKAEVVDQMVWAYIHDVGTVRANQIVKWLDIEGEKKQGPAAWEGPTAQELLVKYASKNSDSLMRVGLALALAIGEDSVNSPYKASLSEEDVRHFTFLEARGYSLSTVEAKRLGRKPKAAPKTTTKTGKDAKTPATKPKPVTAKA